MYHLLHAHTDLSNSRLLDSINKPDRLLQTCFDLGLGGCAFTDHESLGAHVSGEDYVQKQIKNEKKKLSEAEVERWKSFKFIRGNEIYLCRNGLTQDTYNPESDRFYHFILLAKDAEGHEQLRELSSQAFKNSFKRSNMLRTPTYYKDLERIVKKNPGHLIASTACLGGFLPHLILFQKDMASDAAQTLETMDRWLDYIQQIFGSENFFLELQPSTSKEQIYVNKFLLEISQSKNIPYIITTDAHYPTAKQRKIHETYLQSKNGDREVKSFYEFTYVMCEEEIHSLMDKSLGKEAVDRGLANTLAIGERIQNYSLKKPFKLPFLLENREVRSSLPKGVESREPFLRFFNSEEESDRILITRITRFMEKGSPKFSPYQWFAADTLKRLDEELDYLWTSSVSQKMAWSKYLLQVGEYLDYLWEAADTILAPGRGSAVSFTLNYMLGITQVNPLLEKAPMKPWRFLNPERASILDIDTDVQSNRRDRAIKALQQKYGEFRVVRVMTKKTEGSRSAILTAARGLGIDVDTAQYLASFIEADRGLTRSLKVTAYGDPDNGIPANRRFLDEMENNYPELWEVAQQIEGLVNGVSTHAGGVIIVDEELTKTNSLIRINSGEYASAYDLHQSEALSNVKIDLLATDGATRIRTCMDLLEEAGYVEKDLPLREKYEKLIGIYTIDRTSPGMWKMIWENKVISLFQMEQDSGVKGIALTRPKSVEDLATLNSVMRLMASEKGAEQPLDKYQRFIDNPDAWEEEMTVMKLSPDEKALIRRHLETSHGICESQEGMMSLLLEPAIAGWSLGEVDTVRKAVAKKDPKLYEELSKKFFKNAEEKNLSPNLTSYVWNVLVNTQKGYSFNLSHTLSYSLIALQEMNLAFHYPTIFWNTANLIVDSASDSDFSSAEVDEDGNEIKVDSIEDENESSNFEEEDDSEEEEEDYEEEEDEEELEEWEEAKGKAVVQKKKKVAKSVDYGKIASALGRFLSYGIMVRPPNINTSKYTFTPDAQTGSISYGLRGISQISNDLIKDIIQNRPYTGIEDFMMKVKISKPKMVSLIKSGAFDEVENKAREQIMEKYLSIIADVKKRVTLQNMKMLTERGLLPASHIFYGKLYGFNQYLKAINKEDPVFFTLDQRAFGFYSRFFDVDKLQEGFKINRVVWEKMYKAKMAEMSTYLKQNQPAMLLALNQSLTSDVREKYGSGSISKWEMDSISFYYHDHELSRVNYADYHLSNFFSLPLHAPVAYSFPDKRGGRVNVPQTSSLIGTVIDKNKIKRTVKLLTVDGVVNLKIWNTQFAKYDKQISEKGSDGKKHVVEKSWFKRGTLLLVTGVRRENNFVPKVNKTSAYEFPILKIVDVSETGELTFKLERDE